VLKPGSATAVQWFTQQRRFALCSYLKPHGTRCHGDGTVLDAAPAEIMISCAHAWANRSACRICNMKQQRADKGGQVTAATITVQWDLMPFGTPSCPNRRGQGLPNRPCPGNLMPNPRGARPTLQCDSHSRRFRGRSVSSQCYHGRPCPLDRVVPIAIQFHPTYKGAIPAILTRATSNTDGIRFQAWGNGGPAASRGRRALGRPCPNRPGHVRGPDRRDSHRRRLSTFLCFGVEHR
jgi:hypothetical protein